MHFCTAGLDEMACLIARPFRRNRLPARRDVSCLTPRVLFPRFPACAAASANRCPGNLCLGHARQFGRAGLRCRWRRRPEWRRATRLYAL